MHYFQNGYDLDSNVSMTHPTKKSLLYISIFLERPYLLGFAHLIDTIEGILIQELPNNKYQNHTIGYRSFSPIKPGEQLLHGISNIQQGMYGRTG